MRTYRGQKAGLTRAINSGNPQKVLGEVRRTVAEWDGMPYPDDWHRWNIAWQDAIFALARSGQDVKGLPMDIDSFEVVCGMVRYAGSTIAVSTRSDIDAQGQPLDFS